MLEAAIAGARLTEAGGGALLFGAALLLLLAATPAPAATWSRPLLTGAAAVVAAGSLLALALQTVDMAGSVREGLDPGALGGVALDTGFGRSVVVRVMAAGAAAALLRRRDGTAVRAGVSVLGAAALASLAWSGHGAADRGVGGWVHLGGDLAHLLSAGAWLGALSALAVMSLGGGGGERDAALGGALAAFSGVGLLVVAGLVASGLVNGWFLLGPERWRALAGEAWGRLLLLKLVLFALMLALAALNRRRLAPALAREAAAGDAGRALRALRRSVAAEAALGLCVLAAAAVMGGLAPPASQG